MFLANIAEIIMRHISTPLFIRELNTSDLARYRSQLSYLFAPNFYKQVLKLRGGLVQLKGPGVSNREITPFIEFNDCLLINDQNIRDLVEAINRIRAAEKSEKLINLDDHMMNISDTATLQCFCEFSMLLLFHVSIYRRFNYKNLKFINLKNLLRILPENLIIVCRYNDSFPRDWIADIKKQELVIVNLFCFILISKFRIAFSILKFDGGPITRNKNV